MHDVGEFIAEGRDALANPRLGMLATLGGFVVVVAAAFAAALSLQAQSVPDLFKVDPDRIGLNAPFIKTQDEVTDKMVEVAQLTADDVVYDLGCGDGRLVITAALKHGCRGVGFDINLERVAEARENVKLHGVEHLVEIRDQDVFTVDMKEADVVLMYLLPWMIRKLIPQFQEMAPGSRIVSHDFVFGGDPAYIPADSIDYVPVTEDGEVHHVHKWTTPLDVPPPERRRVQ
ncbi:MAG: SAM-dependent methyltransferase [Planctomycetaceae bacterium]|nr:SAM-dependent methyltransferase [Planctomycetaceae bacterium]